MKNKGLAGGLIGFFIGVAVTAIFSVIIFVFLYVFGVVKMGDEQTTKCITNKSNSQVISITKDELMDVYKDVVKNTMYQKFTYGVVDINNDGIEELIFKTGSSEADYNYYIYTYDESFEDSKNHVVLVGDLPGGHSALYKMNDGTLMHLRGQMGEETVTIYTLENDWLVRKSVKSRETSSDYTKGDKEIKMVSNTNLSLFD